MATTASSNGHAGVTCDVCKTTDFKGLRFKCLVCFDFDVCENCREKQPNSPTVRHALHHPLQCIVLGTDYSKYYGGEVFDSSRPMSLTCPYCGEIGFEVKDLYQHFLRQHPCPSIGSRVLCPACCGTAVGDPNMFYSNLASHFRSRHECDTLPGSPKKDLGQMSMAAAVRAIQELSGTSQSSTDEAAAALRTLSSPRRAIRLPPAIDAIEPGDQPGSSFMSRLNLLPMTGPVIEPSTTSVTTVTNYAGLQRAAAAAAAAIAAAVPDSDTTDLGNPGSSPLMPPLLSSHNSPNLMPPFSPVPAPPVFGALSTTSRPILGPVSYRPNPASRLSAPAIAGSNDLNTTMTDNNNTGRGTWNIPSRPRNNSPNTLPNWATGGGSRTMDFYVMNNSMSSASLPNINDVSARSSHSLHRSTTFDNRAALGGWTAQNSAGASGTTNPAGTPPDNRMGGTHRKVGRVNQRFIPSPTDLILGSTNGFNDFPTPWIFPQSSTSPPASTSRGLTPDMQNSLAAAGIFVSANPDPAELFAHLQEEALFQQEALDEALLNNDAPRIATALTRHRALDDIFGAWESMNAALTGNDPWRKDLGALQNSSLFKKKNKTDAEKNLRKTQNQQQAIPIQNPVQDEPKPIESQDDPRLLSNIAFKQMEEEKARAVNQRDQLVRSLFAQELAYAILMGADDLLSDDDDQREQDEDNYIQNADDATNFGLNDSLATEEDKLQLGNFVNNNEYSTTLLEEKAQELVNVVEREKDTTDTLVAETEGGLEIAGSASLTESNIDKLTGVDVSGDSVGKEEDFNEKVESKAEDSSEINALVEHAVVDNTTDNLVAEEGDDQAEEENADEVNNVGENVGEDTNANLFVAAKESAVQALVGQVEDIVEECVLESNEQLSTYCEVTSGNGINDIVAGAAEDQDGVPTANDDELVQGDGDEESPFS